MLDKTRKIIYIITGTLTIISLVFMLMHKVGLCASSDTTILPASFDSLTPIPIGIGYGYDSSQFVIDDSWIARALELCENSSVMPFVTPTVKMIAISEYDSGIGNDYVDFYAFYQRNDTPYSITYNTSNSSNIRLIASNAIYVSFRYTISSDSFSTPVYQSSQTWYLSLYGSNNYCFGNSQLAGKYIFNRDSFYTHYPVYLSSDLYGDYFQYISTDSSSNFVEGEVTSLPSFDSLIGVPDSNDDSVSLFDKLKGWLSTISGNIQKGFKNIEDNLKSFFQPYFDNFKSFFDILENPEDFLFCSQERQQELLESSQVYNDVQSLQGIGQNIFGVLGATASDHVYWTFDFSGTVLDNCGVVQIDFDWYESIRNYVVPLFLAFFYVGMLLLIIRKIPGIISGASSNSDDK